MILQWITLCLVRENPVFKTSQKKKKKKKELIRNTCAGWFIILKYSTSVSKRSPQWSPGIVLCDSKRMWRGAVAPWALQDLPAGGRFGLPRCHTVPFLGPIFYLFIYFVCCNGLLPHGGLFVNLWSLSEPRWADEKKIVSFFPTVYIFLALNQPHQAHALGFTLSMAGN